MAEPLLPNGKPWEMVQRRELSAGRVKLLFLIAPDRRQWVTIDRELDNSDYHQRIVTALGAQNV